MIMDILISIAYGFGVILTAILGLLVFICLYAAFDTRMQHEYPKTAMLGTVIWLLALMWFIGASIRA